MPTTADHPRRQRHPPRTSSRAILVDVIRDTLASPHAHRLRARGCGTCTVLLDGETVRSCLMLAAGADSAEILTVEGLSGGNGLNPLQEAFRSPGLQCGFCTPGMLMIAHELLRENPAPSGRRSRGLSANPAAAGYQGIVEPLPRRQQRPGGGVPAR